MSQVSIFNLPNECFFTIIKYIKKNCERERPLATDKIKYADLISFFASCKTFGSLLCEWDTDIYFRLVKYVDLKSSSIHIDFEELHIRLKNTSAKHKDAYWSSLSLAIRDAGQTEVVLRYAPESLRSDHMEAIHTVIDQLQNKPNLKELDISIPGYTLEGLGRLQGLETLRLNVRMDIDDLVEICRLNKNLRVLEYKNNETGGKRLAAIAPHCEKLEELAIKMRPNSDASEYTPLATIPRLQNLKIAGVHEKGTLQPLLNGFASNQSKVLNSLSIDDAPLDQNETQAMAQIETLTQVKCGFDDPQSIGLLSQLTKLDYLEILSKHEILEISKQVLSILIESKVETIIELVNLSILYRPKGELLLYMREENANASDYSPLSTLPGLSSYQIHGWPHTGSLKPILNGFRKALTLTDLSLENITAEEIAAVSEIASLKRLQCGFAETQNAELLAQLPVLAELIITTVPSSPGSLSGLLAALASRKSHTLQKFRLLKGKIDPVEAKELARLRSLRTLECQFADPLDIQLLSQLTELKKLSLNANEMFGKISPGVLRAIKSCKKLARTKIVAHHKQTCSCPVDTASSEMFEILGACQGEIYIQINDRSISFNRRKKELHVEFDFFQQNNLAIETFARLESVSHIKIKENHEAGSLREFFAALAMRTNHELESLSITDSLLDFSETTELAKITSLTSFKSDLSDARSFQHLLHLSNFNVFENKMAGRHIVFDKCTGKLTVANNWPCMADLPNATDLSPFASLQNLLHVNIFGRFEGGSMHNFFGQLAAWQGETLQELTVGKPYEMSNADLTEVSRMTSLRTLACGLSHVKDIEIEQLAHLFQLTVLIVESHQTGSLKNFLGILASSECPTLEHLAVRGVSLTPQEVANVSAISSLKRLECAFFITKGLNYLSQRNHIEDLGITTRKGEMSQLDQEIPVKDTLSIEGLAESLHLEELAISSGPERGSLEGLFRALSLKATPKLKNLVLEHTSIDLTEARQLVQVNSITSLKCAFKDEESFSLLATLSNLESLEITSRHEFTNISEHLLDIFRECRKLKTIDLGYTDCNLCFEFLENAVDILKSARNLSTQGPLEIRITLSSLALKNKITAIDKTYLIVTENFVDHFEDASEDVSDN
ncbi:uncharacterized protein LOC111077939 [Drosophila obscura]|uniref:uncharacterized protein LOC111077939 n=1 Tax=Drosophila obscura TaxID=7282 RepID=UPI001BB13DDC|nr:uncharacterized protein LOC111077939 [Drosophila obscura]